MCTYTCVIIYIHRHKPMYMCSFMCVHVFACVLLCVCVRICACYYLFLHAPGRTEFGLQL